MIWALALPWIVAGTSAWASEAQLVRQETSSLKSLVFEKKAFPIKVVEDNANPKNPPAIIATVSGKFNSKDDTLFCLNQVLASPETPSGSFSFEVPLTQPKTEVSFTAISARGTVAEERIILDLADYTALTTPQVADPSAKRWAAYVGLGASSLSYTETNVSTYTAATLAIQASGAYWFANRKWWIIGDAWIDIVPFSSSVAGTAARNFIAHIYGGYRAIQQERYVLGFQLGFQYRTMLVSPATFGFADAFSPALGIEFGISTKQGVFALIPRYSMIFSGFTPRPSEYDLGGALRWSHKINERKVFVEASLSILHTTGTLNASPVTGDATIIKILGGLGF